MRGIRRAVIDIGTNSVKLLVADVRGANIEPVLEESEQTRLGAGFYDTHRLQAGAIAESARAVARFATRARELKTLSLRVIATSAARDAMNPGDLLSAIEQACGMKMEIISGEQEADWAFQGVNTDPRLAAQPLLLMDVGGGSTEFILGQGDRKHFRKSFPLGTVRLLEKLRVDDPPTSEQRVACREWVKDFLLREVRPELASLLEREEKSAPRPPATQLIGTGGTATILARMEGRLENYDRERIESLRLSLDRVQAWTDRLWSLPLAERRKTIGLPEKRADVILTGLAIYESTMEVFGFPELRVSTRGLRFAVVLENQG
jgi:exopolyphosphatase/guanosine-5'-triphosphate,3'-diphosphate pyrophosphatase